jgi:hypothetical protein
MERAGGYSLASLQASNQPTHTYIDTKVILGKKVEINTKDWMQLYTRSEAKAKSEMLNESKGVVLNVVTMKGENYLTEKQTVLIGEGSKLTSGGDLRITARSTANMSGKTEYKNEAYGIIGAESVKAFNQINRNQTVILEDDVTAKGAGTMEISSRMGVDDNITTTAKVIVRSALEFPSSYAVANLKANNDVMLGAVDLKAGNNLWVYAHNGGYYMTRGDVDAATSVKLGVKPDGTGRNNIDFEGGVYVNRSGSKRARMESTGGAIQIQDCMENLHVITTNFVEGSGILGGVWAHCINNVNLHPIVFIDNIEFTAKNGTHVRSGFGMNNPWFEQKADAALYGVGWEAATARLEGRMVADILTNDKSKVNSNGYFAHVANWGFDWYWETACTGWKSSKGYRYREDAHAHWGWCDFCSNDTNWGTKYGFWTLRTNDNALKAAMTKALAPINDVNRMVSGLGDITKARYGEEEKKAAEAIYVFDVEELLEKEFSFGDEQLSRYNLWKNSLTQQDVYLLPNATRLYRSVKLDYVSEILRGNVTGTEEVYDVDIFTALTPYAFQNPVVPIGSSCSLDFANGTLRLPALTDYELYLQEVSGAWLLDNIRSGKIRRVDVPIDQANAFALASEETEADELPTDQILEGLAEDGDMNGWKFYWLGDSPETAKDDNQTLVCLAHHEETDEVYAFRLTKAMIAANTGSIPVSLYLFRDSKADRMGEEKYNVFFFDTPAGQKSYVKVLTNVLGGREMEVPKELRVGLRKLTLEGAEMPIYCMNDHFFMMFDGSDGEVSMFEGFYKNTYDGNTFESDYLKIEGIADGDLNVTIKKDQTVWPEKTDETHALDHDGDEYELVDGTWRKVVEPDAA